MGRVSPLVQYGRATRRFAGVGAVLLGAACGDVVSAPHEVPDSTDSVSPVAGQRLWVNPSSRAQQTANAWRSTRPADADQMQKIADQSAATWLGNWNVDIRGDVAAAVLKARSSGALPVLVAYNIPARDCGSYSGGNGTTPESYRAWISGFANGLDGGHAVIVLEPDALAGITCLASGDQAVRITLIREAAALLASRGAQVYIDAGHPGWQSAATMAARLRDVGVSSVAGFALNVSNFIRDSDNIRYGDELSSLLGGKHYVIDTSRNGLGPTSDLNWCNPAGRALGRRPTTTTGHSRIDAFLWVKVPGESDGSCDGAPASGTWMPEYALGLAQRAAY